MAKKRTAKCTHAHPIALQQEIDRLKSVQGSGFQSLMRYPEFRRLAELLATASFRAEPSKGGSMALANGGGKLGPSDSDGIAVLGRCFGEGDECTPECHHLVVPGYSTPQRPDKAILAQALRVIRDAGDDVAKVLDPHTPRPKDNSQRCGLTACRGKNRRQAFDAEYCQFCGREFVREEVAV